MTRNTSARVAGVTFLVYIAAGLASMALSSRATSGVGMTQKLATMAAQETTVGIIVLLGFVQSFSAIVLGVTLWSLTRAEDPDLAMLGLTFRVGEGVIGGLSIPTILAVLSLASATSSGAGAVDATHTLARYLLRTDVGVPATFFAAGSTMFSWLLLRGRMVPVLLGRLGVVASVILVTVVPLNLAGFLRGPLVLMVWLPMLIYEVVLAVYLIRWREGQA